MCLVRKPDIVKEVWHGVNFVAKPVAHDYSFRHFVSCKLLFNRYRVRMHVEICYKNSPHRFPVDSKLLTSLPQRLAWPPTTESLTAATLCGALGDFNCSESDCLLVSLRLRFSTAPWVLNLSTHL